MRSAIIVLTFTLAACDPGNAPSAPVETASALPAGFPSDDLVQNSANCVVYLGLSIQANATPDGRDAPIMSQAAGQWEASLRIDGGLTDIEARQLIASSVNPLTATPAAERDAAAAWCVEHAPEPDPTN